jgi:tetratricopeptide (TPR) repeat protein
MVFKRWLLFLVCIFAMGALFPDARADSFPPTIPLPSKDVYNQVTVVLKGDDVQQIDSCISQIHRWISGNRVAPDLAYKWLPSLMAKKRYQEVAELALDGMLARPEQKFLDRLPPLRAKALNALDKPDDALQAALVFYNVCSMKETPAAIDLLEVCLIKAHPEDPAYGRRFRSEQLVLAGSTETGINEVGGKRSILKGLPIDPAPFTVALGRWKEKASHGKASDVSSYANLLLAADRATEAEKCFRTLFEIAGTQEELDIATEGIARSIRAQDGDVARANAWLRSLEESGTSTTKPNLSSAENVLP